MISDEEHMLDILKVGQLKYNQYALKGIVSLIAKVVVPFQIGNENEYDSIIEHQTNRYYFFKGKLIGTDKYLAEFVIKYKVSKQSSFDGRLCDSQCGSVFEKKT